MNEKINVDNDIQALLGESEVNYKEEPYMDKIEFVKKTILDISKKYFASAYGSIDITFNNINNEVRSILMQKCSFDFDIWDAYNNICFYLRNDISDYFSLRYTEESLDKVIQKIEKEQDENFDNWFLKDMSNKEQNDIWISPIEKRLFKLLAEKPNL
jgi:hypothetical protein